MNAFYFSTLSKLRWGVTHHGNPNQRSAPLASLHSVSAVSFCLVLHIHLLQKQDLRFVFLKLLCRKKPQTRHFIPFFLHKDCWPSTVENAAPSPTTCQPPGEGSSQPQGRDVIPPHTDSLPSPTPRWKLMGFALFQLNSSPSSLSETFQMRGRLTITSHHQHLEYLST